MTHSFVYKHCPWKVLCTKAKVMLSRGFIYSSLCFFLYFQYGSSLVIFFKLCVHTQKCEWQHTYYNTVPMSALQLVRSGYSFWYLQVLEYWWVCIIYQMCLSLHIFKIWIPVVGWISPRMSCSKYSKLALIIPFI